MSWGAILYQTKSHADVLGSLITPTPPQSSELAGEELFCLGVLSTAYSHMPYTSLAWGCTEMGSRMFCPISFESVCLVRWLSWDYDIYLTSSQDSSHHLFFSSVCILIHDMLKILLFSLTKSVLFLDKFRITDFALTNSSGYFPLAFINSLYLLFPSHFYIPFTLNTPVLMHEHRSRMQSLLLWIISV